MKEPNILLIGCGAHAKRVYIPIIKETEKQFGTKLKAVVELKEKQKEITEYIENRFNNVKYVYVNSFYKKYTHILPKEVELELNKVVKDEKINGVIIATDPLNHMQYAIWAQKQNLHVLMDKPISTYENVSNSIKQSKQLEKDYNILIKKYNPKKAFIINAQRRFLPQFEIIQTLVNDISKKYGMPITSMQSTHSDGQWRLPNEILTLKYHPLLGWGKISHSGYHFIDMASKIVKDSFKFANKRFDKISVYSKFIRPSGVLMAQNQKNLKTIFGDDYISLDSRTDEELIKLYKKNNEAEVDVNSIINLSYKGIPLTNISLNLLHNGFSRRAWMYPNMKDLYKGNGRVRHEYHNIEQGCLQNIQIHSYQSKCKHDINSEEDFLIGGNNHYDIYIFKNRDIIGGKKLEIITGKEIAEKYSLDKSKVMNELARHEAVKQFLEAIIGEREISNLKGNIVDHYLSAKIMSMMYQSGIKNKEIIQKLNKNYEYLGGENKIGR